MTKKEFNSQLSHHIYGKGKEKRNALYFGYRSFRDEKGNSINGFKYMVKGTLRDLKLQELKDVMYNWVVNEIQPPWYVEYRYAETDEKRFKVSLMG